MRVAMAVLWLALVTAALAHLGVRIDNGVELGTDLLALLPAEDRDPALRRSNEIIADNIGRRVLFLVGHPERAEARRAAAAMAKDLGASGLLLDSSPTAEPGGLRRLGRVYFAHRRGLLTEEERRLFRDGKGDVVANRALAQVFGFAGAASADLLRNDPFLLLPAFLASLPTPASRMAMDDEMLSVRDDGATWIMLTYRLIGEPYAMRGQKRLTDRIDAITAKLRAGAPGLRFLKLGTVFFAHSGGQSAMGDTTRIGIAALAAVVVIVIVVFRALGPLWHSLLAIGVGVACAFSLSLAIFREVHVMALLFGSSLIGTTVDYCMHYFCEIFAGDGAGPWDRLRRVLPGLSLGIVTTLIGYSILLLAPFSGLHQIAVFSAAGMLASFATVVLWLPFLDRRRAAPC